MKLSNRNIFALLAASASLLTSCSDDVLSGKDSVSDEEGLIIYVPYVPEGASPENTTRAIGNVNDFNGNEAAFKNLRLFMYKDGNETPIVIDLTKGVEISNAEEGYKGYRVREDLENGEYEMYAVANSTISDNTSKTDLLKARATVPDDISVSGLPMSCPNERMEVDYGSGTYNPVGTNRTISVTAGSSIKVKANLRFAVAKVRVSVLNDLHPSHLMGNVTVTDHAVASSLIENVPAPEERASSKIDGEYYAIPANASSTALSELNVDRKNLTEITPDGETPWVWQTVFYVPERLVQTDDDHTKLVMEIGSDTKELILGHTDPVKGRIVERSQFYDFVGTPQGQFTLDVQRWTPDVLAGALNGSYWLQVDKTTVSIAAGFDTELAYQSNTDVTPESPKFEGQDIYKFERDPEHPGVLLISVNPEIDHAEFMQIKQTDLWKYFTLTAGTIVKKIEVANFDYNDYILSDDMVTIDVNERKQSGDYSSYISVPVSTSMRYIILSKVDWPDMATPDILDIKDKDGNPIPLDRPVEVPATGEMELRISYNGLNSNALLWQEDHDMKIHIKGVDASGNPIMDDDNNPIESIINLYVRTSYDIYRIHLKAAGWNHPHIFVYQCLQLPAGFNYTNGGTRGQIVGQGPSNQETAAMEYDFTGAIAFKGWSTTPGSDNYPNNPGTVNQTSHFFNFNSDWQASTSNSDFDKHYVQVDFAQSHRDKLKQRNGACTVCTGEKIPSNWPGIEMLPDPDAEKAKAGWWYFDLSGVAEPGKALIMFTDCKVNEHAENGNRYPAHLQPGVALFDYPTKEGYFDVASSAKRFTSEDPDDENGGDGHETTTSTFEVGQNYAILFNTSATCWVWTVNGSGATVEEVSKTKGQTWPGSMANRVFTFTPTKAGGTVLKVKYNSVETNEHPTSVSNFIWNPLTERYEATINP